MYCKHCGKEITGDSKFCNYCGKSQDGSSKPLANRPFLIMYLIWAVAHLYLLMGEKSRYTSDAFYPFTEITREEIDGTFIYIPHENWDKFFYDFSEFFVYVFVLPTLLYLVYLLFCKLRKR